MLQYLSLPSPHVCTHREVCCPITVCRKYQVVAQIKVVLGKVRPLLLTSNCSSGGDPGEQARQLFPPWMLRMTGKFSWPKARLWTQKIFSGREKKKAGETGQPEKNPALFVYFLHPLSILFYGLIYLSASSLQTEISFPHQFIFWTILQDELCLGAIQESPWLNLSVPMKNAMNISVPIPWKNCAHVLQSNRRRLGRNWETDMKCLNDILHSVLFIWKE